MRLSNVFHVVYDCGKPYVGLRGDNPGCWIQRILDAKFGLALNRVLRICCSNNCTRRRLVKDECYKNYGMR